MTADSDRPVRPSCPVYIDRPDMRTPIHRVRNVRTGRNRTNRTPTHAPGRGLAYAISNTDVLLKLLFPQNEVANEYRGRPHDGTAPHGARAKVFWTFSKTDGCRLYTHVRSKLSVTRT